MKVPKYTNITQMDPLGPKGRIPGIGISVDVSRKAARFITEVFKVPKFVRIETSTPGSKTDGVGGTC